MSLSELNERQDARFFYRAKKKLGQGLEGLSTPRKKHEVDDRKQPKKAFIGILPLIDGNKNLVSCCRVRLHDRLTAMQSFLLAVFFFFRTAKSRNSPPLSQSHT